MSDLAASGLCNVYYAPDYVYVYVHICLYFPLFVPASASQFVYSNTADFIKKVLSVYTHLMTTFYLSLRAQVAKSTFLLKSPVSQLLIKYRTNLVHITKLDKTENIYSKTKSYNELSQKTRFQSVTIAASCLYNIQRENLFF